MNGLEIIIVKARLKKVKSNVDLPCRSERSLSKSSISLHDSHGVTVMSLYIEMPSIFPGREKLLGK